MSKQLAKFFYCGLQYQQDEVLQAFVEEINSKLNFSVLGVVFYGSCMRSRKYQDAMLDFYVIVDKYSNAYRNYWYRIGNHLLPPNVFFIQTYVNGQTYRAKYAVMTQQGLLTAVSKGFHSYFWARFTQPISYIYASNDDFKKQLADIQCNAAQSFYYAVMPRFLDSHTSSEFWIEGLQLTYAAELRAETKARATHIYHNDKEFYDEVFSGLLAIEYYYQKNKLLNNFKWKIRIVYGKFLSVLRLMKATTTFVGGVDYIAWKIERHTGEPVQVNNKMRKYPWIYCWPVIFRLFKQGRVR